MTADVYPLHVLLVTLAGWINRHQQHVIECLVEENRVLKGQLTGRRLRLNDDERRRLAPKARRLGRRVLRQVATIVTHPGSAEEPGPRRGKEYGRQGAQGPRDPARARPAVLLADVSAGALGGHRRGRLLHQRDLDAARARDLLHAVRDRSPESTGPRGGFDAHPGYRVHGAGGATTDRRGRWFPGAPPGPHL